MSRIHSFYYFVRERLGRKPSSDEEIVDTSLQAMQEGVLDVCAQNDDKWNLWRIYGMTGDQWHRACDLLERAGVASSIMWQSTSNFIYHEFMGDIEYLWTDLEVVERFLMEEKMHPIRRIRLVQELDRRRTWDAGLRRAWLAACTI
jgi:hypothetical protein